MNSRQLIVPDGVFTFYFAENSDIGLIPKISMDKILVIKYSQEDFASNASIFDKHSLEINRIVDEIIKENKEFYKK